MWCYSTEDKRCDFEKGTRKLLFLPPTGLVCVEIVTLKSGEYREESNGPEEDDFQGQSSCKGCDGRLL